MIYPDNFENKLHFHTIREMLSEACLSPMGREWVDDISFSANHRQVTLQLNQTREMMVLNAGEASMPVAHFFDLREPLKKLKVEGLFLEATELFDLKRTLVAVRDIRRFILSHEQEELPALSALAHSATNHPGVIKRIEGVIDKNGDIRDHASPELARIRSTISARQRSVSGKMTAILRKARQDGLVEADATIAIRDGRAVIPVAAANKRKIPGIVQDESASGKTSFIEPAEIVEINNELRELGYAEKREIARILTDMAGLLRPHRQEFLASLHFLGLIDFIRAKARFSRRINAVVPEVKDQTAFVWETAVHPLLLLHNQKLGKPVVPLDIELNDNQRLLVISGPNAGGKSVCLQTVGLLQYMLQCGLPVPVSDTSVMGMFNNIFMDLGDEQSIENDLSTYSSHLLNMKYFLRHGDAETLLLIDEFGTGTEPMLGGAIAETVLDHLNRKGVYGVITTHYTNLKHFASGHEGIINGAMLFDTHFIQPLFKLEMGQPGSSFAFEIAHKIGLPGEVLAGAKERLGEDHINFDKHLREIIRDKHYWEQKRERVRKQDKKLEKLMAQYHDDAEKLKEERARILEKARQEARDLLSETNRRIENTIRGIREFQADKEKTKELRGELEQFKNKNVNKSTSLPKEEFEKKVKQIKERQEKRQQKREVKSPETPTSRQVKEAEKPIEAGDKVMLAGQSVPGEVIEVSGREAVVAFGQITTKVKCTRLKRVSGKLYKKELKRPDPVSSLLASRMQEKKLSFRPDMDVRGMRGEEAVDRVLAHLDEALLCGAGTVKVLHGKGNGILRQMIRQHIDALPYVKNYRDEDIRFGGSGITVIEID